VVEQPRKAFGGGRELSEVLGAIKNKRTPG